MLELGINFEKAEEDAKIKPFEPGDFEYQVSEAKVGVAGENAKAPGRPNIKFVLTVVNSEVPDANGRTLFYYTSLPWTNPDTGELDDSNLNFLTNLCLSTGHKWEGTSFDEQALVGSTGLMKVVLGEYQGELKNEIKKLYAKVA